MSQRCQWRSKDLEAGVGNGRPGWPPSGLLGASLGEEATTPKRDYHGDTDLQLKCLWRGHLVKGSLYTGSVDYKMGFSPSLYGEGLGGGEPWST